MSEEKCFYASVSKENEETGEITYVKEYVTAYSVEQAAKLLRDRLHRPISSKYVYEVKPFYRFECWVVRYINTEYFTIDAYSAEQAWSIYKKKGYTKANYSMTKWEMEHADRTKLPINTKTYLGRITYDNAW